MFDATILASGSEKSAGRSGIFFTAYQIFNELKRNKNIDLIFYCPPTQQMSLKKTKEFQDVPLYPKVTLFDKWYGFLRHKKRSFKINHKMTLKILCHYVLFFESCLFYIPNKIIKKMQPDPSQLNLDAFFSPCRAIPPEINALNIKKYILLHDTIPLIVPQYFKDMQNNGSWFLKLIHFIKANKGIHYFANSGYTKSDFLKYVPELTSEQITVTPLACSDSFHPCSREQTIKSLKKYNLPTDKKYVFSLCSLEPRKNLIRAVKTFIEFIQKNKIDDMVFVLGGGYWEDFINKLSTEIAGLGDYKDKIIKAGYIDDEDLAPLYSGAEWFVYTSQYEGFGLPPLEAMACGCPVITSNNSSLPEVVGDAGLMIDWDSDEQHIKAYEDYYFHPELREQNRPKGLVRAKEFSWEKTVNLIVKEMMK